MQGSVDQAKFCLRREVLGKWPKNSGEKAGGDVTSGRQPAGGDAGRGLNPVLPEKHFKGRTL